MEDMETDNVTFRCHQRRRVSSLGELSESSLFESTRISLPHTNRDDSNYALNQRIHDLEKQLLAANNEIDNLVLETVRMKQELEKTLKIVDMYKKVDPSNTHNTPLLGRKRKRQRISIGLEESITTAKTPLTLSSHLTEQQKEEHKSQQETIATLNLQIQKLQKWLEEEKDRNKLNQRENDDAKIKKRIRKHRVVPTNYYKKTGVLLNKLKIYSKKATKLQKKCTIVSQENVRLSHQIVELQTKHDIILEKGLNFKYTSNGKLKQDGQDAHNIYNQEIKEPVSNEVQLKDIQNLPTIAKQDYFKNKTELKVRKTLIFSDSIGQGLSSKIINNIDKDIKVMNYCKPGANCIKILDNFHDKTKYLNKDDTVAILISRYEETKDYITRKQVYVKLLKDIIDTQDRSFNIIVSGIRYNNINDDDIYNMNKRISHLANMRENIKYVDPNLRDSGKTSSYSRVKELLSQAIVSATMHRFQGSSTLKFIKCTSETNFPTVLPSLKKK